MSSSLPNRSNMDEHMNIDNQLCNYTIYSENIKNPPKMVTTDDGSGTATNPKNIINNRRRSESYAVYSTQNSSFDDPNFIHQFTGEESEFFSSDTLQYPNSLNVDKKIILYKTEMCRTFEETGTCKYGIKCQFAHDPVEVRNIPRHPRYKTEICKTFWQLGNCPYGKRCCFIHTENELKDGQKPVTNNVTNNLPVSRSSVELYGSDDLIIAEDSSILGEIHSHNSSRSASPSKAAEYLKKSISNLGQDSIFNNLSISNLTNLVSSKSITERRRKSIINDGQIDELAMLIGSNCSLGLNNVEEDKAAPSAEDPEFKSAKPNNFELWASESPKPTDSTKMTTDTNSGNFNKFALFDKSPGSRNSSGIWTNSSIQANPTNTTATSFLPSSQFYETERDRDSKIDSLITSIPSGTSSSKSNGSSHHQILIDMLNLLDSSN